MIMSNNAVAKAMASGSIQIENFSSEMLGPTSYRIRPQKLRKHAFDDDGIQLVDQIISLASESYDVEPGEYVVFSPAETIAVAPGYVVDFFPSSWCIEHALLVTAGRLEHGYNFELVFGLFNAGREAISISKATQLVRAGFSWLGDDNLPNYETNDPGRYIKNLEALRRREADLLRAKDDLQKEEEEIAKMKAELEERG